MMAQVCMPSASDVYICRRNFQPYRAGLFMLRLLCVTSLILGAALVNIGASFARDSLVFRGTQHPGVKIATCEEALNRYGGRYVTALAGRNASLDRFVPASGSRSFELKLPSGQIFLLLDGVYVRMEGLNRPERSLDVVCMTDRQATGLLWILSGDVSAADDRNPRSAENAMSGEMVMWNQYICRQSENNSVYNGLKVDSLCPLEPFCPGRQVDEDGVLSCTEMDAQATRGSCTVLRRQNWTDLQYHLACFNQQLLRANTSIAGRDLDRYQPICNHHPDTAFKLYQHILSNGEESDLTPIMIDWLLQRQGQCEWADTRFRTLLNQHPSVADALK